MREREIKREKEREWDKERDKEREKERERDLWLCLLWVSVCACVCVRERERERRECACVRSEFELLKYQQNPFNIFCKMTKRSWRCLTFNIWRCQKVRSFSFERFCRDCVLRAIQIIRHTLGKGAGGSLKCPVYFFRFFWNSDFCCLNK